MAAHPMGHRAVEIQNIEEQTSYNTKINNNNDVP
jgi:hypothetical protein